MGGKQLKQLFKINNQIKIIFYTQFVNSTALDKAKKIKNVRGIITKDTPIQTFLTVIINIETCNTFVHFLTENDTDTSDTWNPDIDIDQLTLTEKMILKMISKQMSSKDISLSANMSLKTVKSHRYNICRKLGLTGQNSLLSYALQYQEWL